MLKYYDTESIHLTLHYKGIREKRKQNISIYLYNVIYILKYFTYYIHTHTLP